MKSAVILLTHFVDRHILAMADRLRNETSADYDVFIALNAPEGSEIPAEASALGPALFVFNNNSLLRLGYPEKCRPENWRLTDHLDTILLSFFRQHPEYSWYWGVEYDVHFQGRWGFLFERFESSKADVLGMALDTAAKTPWKMEILKPPFTRPDGTVVRPDEAIVGFFPLHRLSHRMVELLESSFAGGWNGNYEFTWGTLAKMHGLELEEIGGNGPYVQPHNRNVFYFNKVTRWDFSPGTFVFRPSFTSVKNRENTLWHPVKPPGDYFNHCPADPEKSVVGRLKHAAKSILYSVSIWAWFAFVWRPAADSPEPSPGSGKLSIQQTPA